MVADPTENSYRESRAQDLYDMARITDRCEHIHMFQRTCVPRDIEDPRALDLNSLYCSIMGTTKHVGVVSLPRSMSKMACAYFILSLAARQSGENVHL